MADTEQLIRERAYHLWEQDGRPEGRDLEYWERARFLVGIESQADRFADQGECSAGPLRQAPTGAVAKPEQPAEPGAAQPKAAQPKAAQPRTAQSKADQSKAGQSKAGQSKAGPPTTGSSSASASGAPVRAKPRRGGGGTRPKSGA